MRRVSRIELGQDVSVVAPLFQMPLGFVLDSPTQFAIKKIRSGLAVQLNQQWHSQLPLFGGSPRVCYALEFDGRYFGIAIWSNPVARALPQKEWLELRRLALSKECPYNTASWFIARMIKIISRDYLDITRLISYQDTSVHCGTIYKASNWTIAYQSGISDWVRPNRYRMKPQGSNGFKVRWEYQLR